MSIQNKQAVSAFDLESAFKELDSINYPKTGGVKPNRASLSENFSRSSKTDLLIEDYYDLGNNTEVEAAHEERQNEIAQAKLARIEKIVDLDAKSADDLLPSYVGKTIIQCPQCMTLFYKAPEDIEISEGDEQVVNVGEVCQHCGNDSGYSLIGKVDGLEAEEEKEVAELEASSADYEDTTVEDSSETLPDIGEVPSEVDSEELPELEKSESSTETEEEDNIDTEESTEDAEVEETEEDKEDEEEDKKKKEESLSSTIGQSLVEEVEVNEGLANGDITKFFELCKQLEFETLAEVDEFIKNNPEAKTDLLGTLENELKAVTGESVAEDISTAENSTESLTEDWGVSESDFNEVMNTTEMQKISENEIEQILKTAPKKSPAEIEAEFNDDTTTEADLDQLEDLEEVDEGLLEKCITESLTNTYSNVKDFKVNSCLISQGEFIIEGVINFNSGKNKHAKYIFTESAVKDNKVKLAGYNTFCGNKNRCTLICSYKNNNLISESFKYTYTVNNTLVEGLIKA